MKLSQGRPHSISQLADGSKLSRQAISKHLHVLATVGIVRSVRSGREILFKLDPEPLEEIKDCLEKISEQWDVALSKLKAFVEG